MEKSIKDLQREYRQKMVEYEAAPTPEDREDLAIELKVIRQEINEYSSILKDIT